MEQRNFQNHAFFTEIDTLTIDFLFLKFHGFDAIITLKIS